MIDMEEMFHKLTDWFIGVLLYIPHKDLKDIENLVTHISNSNAHQLTMTIL